MAVGVEVGQALAGVLGALQSPGPSERTPALIEPPSLAPGRRGWEVGSPERLQKGTVLLQNM